MIRPRITKFAATSGVGARIVVVILYTYKECTASVSALRHHGRKICLVAPVKYKDDEEVTRTGRTR